MYSLFKSLFFILFLSPLIIHSQSIEEKINNLSLIDSDAVSDSISKICWDIYQLDQSKAKPLAAKLLSKAKELNPDEYIVAFSFFITYEQANYLPNLDSVYKLAEKENLYKRMGWTYEAKSEYYKNLNKYDSSMICILKARDLYEYGGFTDDLVTVLHTIGDLYYAAGSYNEAELNYRKVIKIKGDLRQWKNWRERVIRNNIGLIEAQRNNFNAAIDSFSISLNEVITRNNGQVDSIAISYIRGKLAEYYWHTGDYNKVENNYNLGIKPAVKYNQYKFAAGLYLTKSRLMLYNNMPDSALYYIKLCKKPAETEFNSLGFNIKLMSFLADIYSEKGDTDTELYYTKRWAALNDSAIAVKNNWRHLQLLAKNENEKLTVRINNQKDKITFLIVSGTILLITLFFTILFIIRLNKANRKLVDKSLKASNNRQISVPIKNSTSGDHNGKPDSESEQYITLINTLNQKMETDRLFLQQDLTIQKLAELLDTNRTYLSKAINQNLNINFSTYINNLRVQEAIELIKNRQYELINIEGIADKCGFKSRSSFIKAFTSYTGVTPSFFINTYKKMNIIPDKNVTKPSTS